MANTFGTDILIQAHAPREAAHFYVEQLGFEVTEDTPYIVSLHGDNINLFIERGPALGPMLEATVDDLAESKVRSVASGCEVIKDASDFPRCYIRDPLGVI